MKRKQLPTRESIADIAKEKTYIYPKFRLENEVSPVYFLIRVLE
jgi:hypothetical protein